MIIIGTCRMLIKDLICIRRDKNEKEEEDLEDPLPEKLKHYVVSITVLTFVEKLKFCECTNSDINI